MLLLAFAGSAAGQQTQPGSAADTPRDAIRALNQAMRLGDVPTIKQLFLATTPAEAQIIDADAQMAAALARLRSAAVKAYGSKGADAITGDINAGATESAARIDAADVVITGDVATITYRDEKNSPFVLKRVNGKWRVPVSQLGKPLEPATLEQRLADLALQRQVVEEMIGQISEKKFADAEKARLAWAARLLQAATSQPATRPQARIP